MEGYELCNMLKEQIDYRADNMSKNYNLPIIKRKNILEELDNKINSKWETKIEGIDFDLIKKWKSQFFPKNYF